MAKEKPILNVVFVGHVDHGKSTTVGRLFYDSGIISEQEMTKLKEEAAKHGKQGFEFAYVMDNLKEERERGVTINLSYKKILTKNFEVTIIDAPGHKDFVKNMITGASQADAAFLVVAADGGVQPQTTEHVSLLRTMGVNNLAVVINKMDTVNYAQEKFEEVKKKVTEVISRVGYKDIPFIPASSLMGDNVTKKSDKMTGTMVQP
jgi:elongation factor 1-alpha